MVKKEGISGDTSEEIDTRMESKVGGDNFGDDSPVCSSSGIKWKS